MARQSNFKSLVLISDYSERISPVLVIKLFLNEPYKNVYIVF